MNIAVSAPPDALGGVQPPPAPKRLEGMQLHPVMMRDILLKTIEQVHPGAGEGIARTALEAAMTLDRDRQSPSAARRFVSATLAAWGCSNVADEALLVALAVRVTSPGPALYWSDRVGRHNRIFRMPKFRSMRIGTPGRKMKDIFSFG